MKDPLSILFLSLEFTASTFSGNGIYAQSQVRALSKLGHRVFVISSKPADFNSKEDKQGAQELVEVEASHWGRLDASAPYEDFAKAATKPDVVASVKDFSPDVVLAVDWSALPLYRGLKEQIQGLAPLVYLNYRVFARTAVGQELELVRGLEAAALSESIDTVVLSRSDRQYLVEHVLSHSELPTTRGADCEPEQKRSRTDGGQAGNCEDAGEHVTGSADPKVLLCALREDMRSLPLSLPSAAPSGAASSEHGNSEVCIISNAADSFVSLRPYLTCCVRLSPEKEAEHFVGLVEELGRRGLLQKLNLTPLMIGSAKDKYAEALKSRLRAVDDSVVIVEEFMGPSKLAEILQKTRLNVHPATYDAFGMTIVEAASQGAPSLVHDGDGAVGATDLLRGSEGEVFLSNMDQGAKSLANIVEQLLGDKQKMLDTAIRAAARARGWSEDENARKLTSLVKSALARHKQALQDGA